MNDMRKLMESVAPLFESYAAKDQIYDRYEELSAHRDNPEVKKYLDKANQCWKDKDIQGCMDALKAGEALVAPVKEALSQDQIVDYIEELHEIMARLQDLGDHATSIVSEIDPGEAQRLEAYGAFDFGTRKNQYDTTLASFIEDLESGQYDDE